MSSGCIYTKTGQEKIPQEYIATSPARKMVSTPNPCHIWGFQHPLLVAGTMKEPEQVTHRHSTLIQARVFNLFSYITFPFTLNKVLKWGWGGGLQSKDSNCPSSYRFLLNSLKNKRSSHITAEVDGTHALWLLGNIIILKRMLVNEIPNLLYSVTDPTHK